MKHLLTNTLSKQINTTCLQVLQKGLHCCQSCRRAQKRVRSNSYTNINTALAQDSRSSQKKLCVHSQTLECMPTYQMAVQQQHFLGRLHSRKGSVNSWKQRTNEFYNVCSTTMQPPQISVGQLPPGKFEACCCRWSFRRQSPCSLHELRRQRHRAEHKEPQDPDLEYAGPPAAAEARRPAHMCSDA